MGRGCVFWNSPRESGLSGTDFDLLWERNHCEHRGKVMGGAGVRDAGEEAVVSHPVGWLL